MPCEYSGIVSRIYPNTAFAMSSDVMKQRVAKRVDFSGPVRQRDIRGTVGVDVLVDTDGNLICVPGFYGHPILLKDVLKDVDDAVRQGRFKPLKERNATVAHVGKLYFELCNIGCGEGGSSMTLLK